MIVLSNLDTLSKRGYGVITEHLAKVSSVVPRIDSRSLASRYEIVVYYGDRTSSSTRDLTFPSKVDSILCQYRELWLPKEATGQKYGLTHVFFQLLRYQGPDLPLVEVIAFHWHPTNLVDVEQHQYDRRPHFHFSLSPEPLQRSHLVSTLGVATKHQNTTEYLDELLEEVAELFAVEVMGRLARTP